MCVFFYCLTSFHLLHPSRKIHFRKSLICSFLLSQTKRRRPDALQSLSFALCHVYARSTRSVSIPAPVYCKWILELELIRMSLLDADIVCSRAKNHYEPGGVADLSESATNMDENQANSSLEAYRRGFKPVHAKQSTLMYFSVSS